LSSVAEIRCLCGLDEAGLGPILGPLVVAGVALDGPAGTDPWDALETVVARRRPGPRQVQVADSKKVHQGKHALARLERTVLAFLGAWHGSLPRTLRDLLRATGHDPSVLSDCPWYEGLDAPLPLANPAEEIELRAHLLTQALDAASIRIAHIAVAPLDVAAFNASIAATDNKSETHFQAYANVLSELLQRAPDGAHVVADRCGGRVRYGSLLRGVFTDARIETESERGSGSIYRIRRAETAVRLTFVSRGEEHAFPTALASCFAKYTREAMMSVLNAWFAARLPGLKPTAGYYVDGHRFLADVEEIVDREQLPRERLIRCR
jgi:ribonuclease HII